MATKATDIEKQIDKFVSNSDEDSMDITKEQKEEAFVPEYRVVSEDKIPVSSKLGKIWEARKDTAVGLLESGGDLDRWNEAIRYYRNDQSERTRGEDGQDRGTKVTSRGTETENIVFANTTALVPAVYAKNPKVEISAAREDKQDWADTQESLINAIFSKKGAPGIDLKPKMKRAVLMSTLTNIAFIEVGYVQRAESSDGTLAELNALGIEYAQTKDKDKIKEIEGKFTALEDKVDVLRPSGPWVKFRKPQDVLRDPDANEMSEARWVMIRDHLPTEFIQAMYGQKNEKGEWVTVYHPTHVLKAGKHDADAIQDEIANFKLFETGEDKGYKEYGYKDDTGFRKGQRTCVWYVWDKTTRRVLLFADNNWKWPIWVWNDPYGFPSFFPLTEISFYIDPVEFYARSDTTYYLDQQDAINMINNEVAKTRAYIVGKVIYNSKLIKSETVIDEFLAGTSQKRVLGVDVPVDTDLTKLFAPFVPQSAHMLETVVFDKARLLEAIDRVSPVTNVMRGVEYKTNTTNKAIESYESNTQTRLDEKIDVVEDALADIGSKIGHLCVQFMTQDEVAGLIGEEKAAKWEQDKPTTKELASVIHLEIAGGSTLKPTSVTKKQQAIQISQALGQFANVAPAAALTMLQVMERAFDEVVIKKEDWEAIRESIQASAQKGSTSPGEGGSSGGGGNELAQVEQLIDGLPPDLRVEFGKALAKGVPIKKAVAGVVQIMEQSQQQSNPNQENV